MRVLQILPAIASESGGPVRSTLANCRAVCRVNSSISITLASTEQGLDDRWKEEVQAQMPAAMDLRIFSAVGRNAFTFSPRLTAWLYENVTSYDLVVVRALLHPVSSAAAWIARRYAVPYIVVPHGTLSRYTFRHRRRTLKRIYFRLIEKRTILGAAALRYTSEMEQVEAPASIGAVSSSVVPHPYEPRYSSLDLQGRSAHQILFLSRLHPMKGIDVLLEALPIVRRQIPDLRVTMAGTGATSYERYVRSKIADLCLGDVVELTGFVEGSDKVRLLRESSVFVLPSHRENFGVAVVEAMDAGLPVVVSRGVGIWRDIERAHAGLALKRRSPECTAVGLLTLLHDKELRMKMGRNGRALVRRAFDSREVGLQLAALYRSAARC